MHDLARVAVVVLVSLLGGCASPAGRDRVADCALEQLPKYRACMERVASEARTCEEGFRFRAKLWCDKRHAMLEAAPADLATHAKICLHHPPDSPECRSKVERLLRTIAASGCVEHVWEGKEDWTPPPVFATCRSGTACCAEPASRSHAACDQAAAGAIRRCASGPSSK